MSAIKPTADTYCHELADRRQKDDPYRPKNRYAENFRQQYAELDAAEYQLRELPPEQAAAYLLLINQKRQKLLRLQKVLTGLLVGVIIFWIILVFVIS